MPEPNVWSFQAESGELVYCDWVIRGERKSDLLTPIGVTCPATIGIKASYSGRVYGTYIEVTDKILNQSEAVNVIKRLLFWIFRNNFKNFDLSGGLQTHII